jgi:hypothetical protein
MCPVSTFLLNMAQVSVIPLFISFGPCLYTNKPDIVQSLLSTFSPLIVFRYTTGVDTLRDTIIGHNYLYETPFTYKATTPQRALNRNNVPSFYIKVERSKVNGLIRKVEISLCSSPIYIYFAQQLRVSLLLILSLLQHMT